MRILVTGASGYLGSQLCKHLERDYDIIALLRSTSDKTPLTNSKCKMVCYDTFKQINTALAKLNPDIIINTVALYGRKNESFHDLVYANIDFPTQLLALANKYSIKAFIHTGTSLPDDVSPYALTKNTFSRLAKFNSSTKLKFINIALEHFYGPRDDETKFLSFVVHKCKSNENLELTKGSQKRDFIHISDVISAYKTVIDHIESIENNETIPLGSGNAPTIKETVELVHSCCHSQSKLVFGKVKFRENELMYSKADISKLLSLGWKPSYELKDGIMDLITKESTIV